MDKCVLRIITFGLIIQICLSTHECNRTYIGNEIRFDCPSSVANQELNLFDYTTRELDNITKFISTGSGATSPGPFTSIPVNLCLLRNLESIDFTNNAIVDADPSGSLFNCLPNLSTIKLNSNRITTFPSTLTVNKAKLRNVYFGGNQLTSVPPSGFYDISMLQDIDFSSNQITSFELWAFKISGTANFKSNKITTITNSEYISLPLNATASGNVLLDGNGPILQLTDAIYPMYNSCEEVKIALDGDTGSDPLRLFISFGIGFMSLGSTKLDCSCDQYYIKQAVTFVSGGTAAIPLFNATCTDGKKFENSACFTTAESRNSTVNFTQVTPRLCKIFPNEEGNLTTVPNISKPSVNASVRPHYETRWINPGACLFRFLTETTMSFRCNKEVVESTMIIPDDLLGSSYMSTITRVSFSSPISTFPRYLCSLPSRIIDLSGQNFTSLTSETFSCLDQFTQVNLASNQLSSVNVLSGNFKNLTKLDLSSNKLTAIPHSILRPTPSSLNMLDLSNNSITNIDLFLYTLQNISVILNNNPINNFGLTNPMNVTLSAVSTNATSSARNISFPASVSTGTFILNDNNALTASACSTSEISKLLVILKETFADVRLRCDCESINIKTIYQNASINVSDIFNCSTGTNFTTLIATNFSSCATAINFSTRCPARSTAPNPSEAGLMQTTASNDTARTGLIVGLVVGLVGLAVLVAIVIAVVCYLKNKRSAPVNKPVGRAHITSREGETSAVQSRISTRNPRSVKLTPLNVKTSKLSDAPVTTTAGPTSQPPLRSNQRAPNRGIPLRLNPLRSPSNVAPQ